MTTKPSKASFAWAAIAGLLLAAPWTAHAGGLARPNVAGARGIGMGGAFSAIADDPTALHYNPAGLARLTKSSIYACGEIIFLPRTYTPAFDPDNDPCVANPDLPACQEQSPGTAPSMLPALGFATRLSSEGIPSRLAFGVGLWNTFGGQLDYSSNECETCGPGGTDNRIGGTILKTQDAVIELVPGIAYEVNDVLAIGAAVRIGIGLFNSEVYKRPNDAELSGFGLGAGATIGVLLSPTKSLNIASYYRTPLYVSVNGDGVVHLPAGDVPVDLELTQRWPQQMGAGVAYQPIDGLTLAGQFDWHGWAINNVLDPQFAGQPALTREAEFQLDWDNSWAIHFGTEYEFTDKIAARAGYTYDRRAVPNKTMERQFLDSNKMMAALGASYIFNPTWRVDVAFESLIPMGAHKIEDNSALYSDWPPPPQVVVRNFSPGEHESSLYSLELAVQYLY